MKDIFMRRVLSFFKVLYFSMRHTMSFYGRVHLILMKSMSLILVRGGWQDLKIVLDFSWSMHVA